MNIYTGPYIMIRNEKKSYFSTKTYVVGTQKNEMVFMNTQLMDKKIFTILGTNIWFI